MGTPAVVAKWLFAHNGIHPVDEPLNEAGAWHVKVAMDIPTLDFDVASPAAWAPDSSESDVGGFLRKVIPAYGHRLGDASVKVCEILQKEARSPTGSRASSQRVPPKRRPEGHFGVHVLGTQLVDAEEH